MSTSRRRSRSGQTAIEFLATVTMLLLVFTAIYGVVVQRQTQIIERQVGLQAQTIAERVAYELDLALTEGDGYSRTFRLQERIGAKAYNVSVTNGTVVVRWGNSLRLGSTAALNVTGSLEPGTNTIYNTGDRIRVE